MVWGVTLNTNSVYASKGVWCMPVYSRIILMNVIFYEKLKGSENKLKGLWFWVLHGNSPRVDKGNGH
jgi:hypothetical protein